jgi:predicted acylesterase/phospholipase RssA
VIKVQENVTGNELLLDPSVYRDPSLSCDLVMKGGITSGVTYPKAVCEIARTFRLRSVGGTSAGAIAAAAAAAAEVGRNVEGAGFARLAQLPSRISAVPRGQANSVLFNLFQPSKGTGPLFRVMTGALQGKGRPFRLVRKILQALLRSAPVAAVIGASLGLTTTVLLAVLYGTQPEVRGTGVGVAGVAVGVVTGLVLAVIGLIVGPAVSLIVRGMKALSANRFGMCSGFAPGTPASADTPDRGDLQVDALGKLAPKPLTTWLADEFDALAGVSSPDRPLTLGDLAHHGVNLKMFTTNLTEGTPYTLPFRTRGFFFSAEDFGEYFPERIVRWMVEHGPEPRDDEETDTFRKMREHAPPLLPLPDPEDFPVVVMTRMSLSFPILLSAVPLWALLWSEETRMVHPVQCWFSDGGISSNFPIHFFDSALPRWPTFGLNLGPGENLDPVDQRKNIWVPMTNAAGVSPRWGHIKGVVAFVRSILDTMQNWSDNAQTRVPGYRDRIVLIKHTKDEGGINLNMDPELIARFSDRGRVAGEFLAKRFATQPSSNPGDRLSWENHRWLRYRSVMPLVEDLLVRFAKGYDWPPQPAPNRTYAELIRTGRDQAPSYDWRTVEQEQRADDLTGRLIELTRAWAELSDPVPAEFGPVDLSVTPKRDTFRRDRPFAAGAPRPRPALRILRDF